MLVGTDGCSAPNYALPLSALARGMMKLATRGPTGDPLDAALARVRAAMQAHPVLVSGPTRFDYQLASAFGGRIVAKGGAEGVQAMGFSDLQINGTVLQQSLLLMLLSFAVGLVLSFGLYALMAWGTGFPMELTWRRASLVFVLTLAASVMSGVLALRKVRAADPADLF